MFQDLLLLDEIKLSKDDFFTADGRFYFSLAKHLRNKGFSVVDEVTILSNTNENVQEEFNSKGGYDVIQNLIDVISLKNWETYLNILYRENILMSLHRDGFNLNMSIEHKDKKIKALDLFRKMDSELLIDWLVNKFSSYEIGTSSKVIEECKIDFTDDFISSLEEGEDVGVPFETAGLDMNGEEVFCLPRLSRQMGGFLEGTFNLICGYSSVGKSTLLISIIMSMLNQGKKVCIISNEQKCKAFKVNFMIWNICKVFKYYKLTKNKLLSGDWNDEDKNFIKKFQRLWKDNYSDLVRFIALEDASMPVVKKKIREYSLRDGFDFFIYDTMKLDFENSTNQKEYLSLIQDSRTFDALAKKYNITIIATVQMAINTQGNLWCDASMLSQSKQIKEVAESMLIMRIVYAEELDEKNKYYCHPYNLKKVGDNWQKEKYETDDSRVYRAIFLEKTRSGSNSGDTGTAYLLEYDGSHGIFREKAFMKPKHGKIGS